MRTRNNQTTTIARPVGSASERTASRRIEKPIDFSLDLPHAQSVVLAGTFNNWDLKRTPMRKEATGKWTTTLWLPKGRYEYQFVADGQWIKDPKATDSVINPFGTINSVLLV
jgi:1,4-alpha-glucan branching enzyme